MRSRNGVGPLEQGCWTQFFTVDTHRISAFKLEFHVLRLVRRVFRVGGVFEHVRGRLRPGVLENTALEADVQQVCIGAPGVLDRGGNRDSVLSSVILEVCAASELPFTPRGHGLNFGAQRVGGQLEAHLVVAFSGCSVRNRHGTFFFGNVNHRFGNEWAGNAGSQQVITLVQGARAHHGEHKITHKFFFEV